MCLPFKNCCFSHSGWLVWARFHFYFYFAAPSSISEWLFSSPWDLGPFRWNWGGLGIFCSWEWNSLFRGGEEWGSTWSCCLQPRNYLPTGISGAVVVDVSLELGRSLPSFHALSKKAQNVFPSCSGPPGAQRRICSLLKNHCRRCWVMDSLRPVGKCFRERRSLFSGCGPAEPCRCSKRAILFSFWLGWILPSGLISNSRSLRILELKKKK